MSIKTITRKKLTLGLLALVLAGLMSVVALRVGPLSPVRVTTTQATHGRVTAQLFGIGTVEARRSIPLGPTAAGRVKNLLVDAGDVVQAGQTLAEMDPVDLDERLRALAAAIERAHSGIRAAEAGLQDARAREVLAETSTRRYEDLAAQNFISAGAVEARQQERTSARAASSMAEANLSAVRQDLQRLIAEREGLQRQRGQLRLIAPLNGLVASRDAEPGAAVVAGQAVLRVIDPMSLWVKVRLDQGRSQGLALGLPASIVLRSRQGTPLSGKLARLEILSDSVTEERIAQVEFDAIPQGISIGELAEVTLSLPPTAETLVLPNAAIRRHQGKQGAWLIDEGRLRFVVLRLGATSLDGKVQVLEGLSKGQTVVVHSERELSEGQRFKQVESLGGKGTRS